MRSNTVQLFAVALALLTSLQIPPPCRSEFTVITSESSTLVDEPQTGFSDHARTDPVEQQAVYEIMEATGNGWANSIPDVCRGRWHGIECIPDKDEIYHVVSLSFGALSDDTAFPTCDQSRSFLSPSLTKLPHVRSLFFYQCFTNNPQPIPSLLGRMGSTLRSLVLRENGHVGPIPAQLGNLTSLRVLDLHGNKLTSSIPPSLAGLLRLQLLDLSGNGLSGRIPRLKLPDLNVLDLNNNLLQGRIPPTLGGSSSLVKMDLSRNRIMGPIPDYLNGLHSLILLDLSNNLLSGPFPNYFLRGLTSLQALILNKNPMGSFEIPDNAFEGLNDLVTLVLSDMGLGGNIPEAIGRLPSLRVLHLDGNHLKGTVPGSFRNLERLGELRISDNQLTGALPFGREALWRMGKKLRASNNSGLCYDAGNGREETADSAFLWGINPCEHRSTGAEGTPPPSLTASGAGDTNGQTPKHLSRPTSHYQSLSSSSSSPINGFTHLHIFVVTVGILLSGLPVFQLIDWLPRDCKF